MISTIPALVMCEIFDNTLIPLAIIGTIILILFLMISELSELSGSHNTITAQKLTVNINVIILPLIFTFGIIVVINIIMVIY